jgi:expansin (peptidoglycan-binding protein)
MHEPVRPPRHRVRSPWAWGAVGVLALVLLGASTLRFVTASCAAELPLAPPAGPLMHGLAYYYNPGDGEGSCSFGPLPAAGRYASVGPAQYAGGAACGSYLEVTGPDGRVRAEVVDLCPGCAGGGLDMSQAAFGRVASMAAGTAQVSYRVIRDPRLPGPLELRVAQSASAGWLAVQVLNNGNPLRSVQVAPAGTARWRPLVLNSDGFWAAPSGAGPGPFRFRVTDTLGHRAVLPGIRLLPGSVQRTRVRMYTAAAAAAGQPGRATHGARPGQPGPGSSAAGNAPHSTIPHSTIPHSTTPHSAAPHTTGPHGTVHRARAFPGSSGGGPHC